MVLSPSPGTSGPLLERRDELAVLESLLEDAAAGSGGAVVVTGAAGTGKTALLTAARNAAGEHGLLPLHARGRELERDVGFGIATALLGPLVRERGGPPSGLAMLTSTLFGQGDGAGPAPSGDELVIGLYWLVDALCRDQGGSPAPLLLAVDDLHWTDTGSLRFLEHLTDRLDELPVAVVAAARPERRLSGLMAQRHARAVAPAPLSPAAVDALARRSFPDAEPGFARACARVTGGNPFLMVELLRSVRDAGIAPTEGAAAALIPDTVLRSTVARLAGLPAPARRLAEAVAVLGDDAPLPRAAALARMERAAAERAADALAAAGLLRPGAPLAFTHPLIGSAVHADLPRFARARAHRTAAGLLADAGEPPEAVAGHLLRTEPLADPATAAALATAAERAARGGDGPAAMRLLRRALDEPPPPARRPGLLADLAAVQLRAGDRDAERTAGEALRLAGLPAERARAHDLLARARLSRGDLAGANAHGDAALALLETGGPDWQDALARHLGAVAFRPGQAERVRSWLAPFLADAGRGRPPAHPGLRVHLALHLALHGMAASGEVAAHAVGAGTDPRVRAEEHGVLSGLAIHALVLVDHLEDAEHIADIALSAAQRQGGVIAYANAAFHRALCRHQRGALTDAWDDLEQARRLGAAGWPGGAGWIGELLVNLAIDLGDREAAGEGARLVRQAPEDSMEQALCHGALARLHLLDGRPGAAASAALEAGRRLGDDFGVDHPGLLAWRPLAAIALHAAGEPGRARALAAEGVERATELGLARPLGAALRAAGLVATPRSAITLLERAVDVLAGTPAALEHARALVCLGVALRQANRRQAARDPLRHGLSLAEALGCRPLADQARAELLATGARPRRTTITGRAALTPAERRVADLAAAGNTNRQIAQALFVTTKTIETHLTRIYRKLRVPGRSDLPAALETAHTPP